MKEWTMKNAHRSLTALNMTISEITRHHDQRSLDSKEIHDLKNAWKAVDEIMEVMHELGHELKAAGMAAHDHMHGVLK